jgi:hypothetical protein
VGIITHVKRRRKYKIKAQKKPWRILKKSNKKLRRAEGVLYWFLLGMSGVNTRNDNSMIMQ